MWYSRTSGVWPLAAGLEHRQAAPHLVAPVVLQHDDVVAEVRDADVRDAGRVEELRDLEREQQAHAATCAALHERMQQLRKRT